MTVTRWDQSTWNEPKVPQTSSKKLVQVSRLGVNHTFSLYVHINHHWEDTASLVGYLLKEKCAYFSINVDFEALQCSSSQVSQGGSMNLLLSWGSVDLEQPPSSSSLIMYQLKNNSTASVETWNTDIKSNTRDFNRPTTTKKNIWNVIYSRFIHKKRGRYRHV